MYNLVIIVIFFFKQKTAYEMRICDWSSDVCSSDLLGAFRRDRQQSDVVGDFEGARVVPPGLIEQQHRMSAGRHACRDFGERSEERRVGKEGVSQCRSGWSPYNSIKTLHRHANIYKAIYNRSNIYIKYEHKST